MTVRALVPMLSLAIASQPAVAQSVPAPDPAQLSHKDLAARVKAARARLAVFDGFGMANVAGLKFVKFNTGIVYHGEKQNLFNYDVGWLVSESKEKIELLVPSCVVIPEDRTQALDDDARKLARKLRNGDPQPLEYVELDLAKVVAEMYDAPVRKDFDRIWNFVGGGLGDTAELALFARWCFERGLNAEGLRLLDRADIAAKEESQLNRSEGAPTDQVIVNEVATRLYALAIEEANQGVPRERLQQRWNAVSALPENKHTSVAREYVKLYAQQIQEDKTFVDAEPPDTVGKVVYWMHKLRDADSVQETQPGGVDVFRNVRTSHAAEELRRLGWAALPALIDHLDDMRPTRCMGMWRNFAPDSYYLFRYADCCQQIFEAITGVILYQRHSTRGSLTNDGLQGSAKIAAQDWWSKSGSAGQEAYLLGRLDPDRLSQTLFAAQALHERLKSDAGLDPLSRAVRKAAASDKEEWGVLGALKFLKAFTGDATAQAFVASIGSTQPTERYWAIVYAAEVHDRRVAEVLVAALDDTNIASQRGTPDRYCDLAADSLTQMLRYPQKLPKQADLAKRDAFISQLRKWWAENKAKIDWTALGRGESK
jgi:hypothetical protein